jgi:pimeloyl-ACP methyl ester carboxylesterase
VYCHYLRCSTMTSPVLPRTQVYCRDLSRIAMTPCVLPMPQVYLAGHSRGGKLSALAATQDTRVKALCLMDPVDVTQYAPLSDR